MCFDAFVDPIAAGLCDTSKSSCCNMGMGKIQLQSGEFKRDMVARRRKEEAAFVLLILLSSCTAVSRKTGKCSREL